MDDRKRGTPAVKWCASQQKAKSATPCVSDRLTEVSCHVMNDGEGDRMTRGDKMHPKGAGHLRGIWYSSTRYFQSERAMGPACGKHA